MGQAQSIGQEDGSPTGRSGRLRARSEQRRRDRDASVDAEREVFSAAFHELYPQAYRVAFRLLGSAEASEDATAEAFARAYANWSRIAELPWRDAWIMKTTANVALNMASRKPTPLRRVRPVVEEDATATRMALVAALSVLADRQREAIVLHHLAGMTEAEVADAMGVAPSTVKTHLKRGMAILRDDLGTTDAS